MGIRDGPKKGDKNQTILGKREKHWKYIFEKDEIVSVQKLKDKGHLVKGQIVKNQLVK